MKRGGDAFSNILEVSTQDKWTFFNIISHQTGNINNKLSGHFKNAIILENDQNYSSQFELPRVSLMMLTIF